MNLPIQLRCVDETAKKKERKENARMHRMHDTEFLKSVYYGT